jgi:hypothetical protein
MRLSEKTLELSITSQLTHRLGIGDAVWFGLTQKQESRLGFDVISRIDGVLVVLQFKASSVLVHPRRFQRRRRRFRLPHGQLDRLQTLAAHFPVSVFYVFPHLGTTEELAQNHDLVAQSYLLDVAALPRPFPAPTNHSSVHNAYLDPPECEIRSNPYSGKVLALSEFVENLAFRPSNARAMVAWLQESRFSFKGMRAYGLLIPASRANSTHNTGPQAGG